MFLAINLQLNQSADINLYLNKSMRYTLDGILVIRLYQVLGWLTIQSTRLEKFFVHNILTFNYSE